MDIQSKTLPTLDQLAKSSILVVGDIMLDRYWFGRVERISPEAPVPVAKISHTQDRLGGAANVASNIAALGGKVSVMGIVGDDEAGTIVQQMLESLGVGNHLVTDAHSPTTLKMRVLGGQQQLLRVDFEETASTEAQTALEQSLLACVHQFDVVVFSDYAKGALAHISALIALARNAGCYVFVDPKGDSFQRYAGANVLTPNRHELRQAMGSWHSEAEMTQKAFEVVARCQLDALIVTRSEEGMSLYQEQNVHSVAALAREVFDVSGAGDTVIATLALMVATGYSLKDAMVFANLAGSVVVGKLGTSSVHYSELETAWKEHFRSAV